LLFSARRKFEPSSRARGALTKLRRGAQTVPRVRYSNEPVRLVVTPPEEAALSESLRQRDVA
jgi:hypothetical protein